MFKFTQLQFYGHQALQFTVVEKKVNVIIFLVNGDAFLPGQEGEITAKLQYKLL